MEQSNLEHCALRCSWNTCIIWKKEIGEIHGTLESETLGLEMFMEHLHHLEDRDCRSPWNTLI